MRPGGSVRPGLIFFRNSFGVGQYLSDPLPYAVGEIMKNTALVQMELEVKSQIRNGYRNARYDRQKRAAWWFGKMRHVVDLALPSQPMRPAPAEQTYLSLRQTSLL
jgi:hypothetical protein